MKIPFENPFKWITDLRPVGPNHCGGDPANLILLQGHKNHVEWPNVLDLVASADYNVFGEEVGALYLGDSKMVFGWNLEGVHVHDLPRTISTFYDGWVNGLRSSFPAHITWKLHVGSRWSSVERTIELSNLLVDCDNDAVAQLICDEIATIQDLTQKYARCDRFIHLYCYYWGSRDYYADAEDQIEGWVKGVFDTVGVIKSLFFGTREKAKVKKIEDLFQTAFYRGYQATKNKLKGTWGLNAKPMTHDVLLAHLRARVSKLSSPISPHKINVNIDERGIQVSEEINNVQHISNWLVKDSAIDLAEQGVSIKTWNPETERIETDHIGILEAREKFSDWAHEFHQCKSLWDLFAEPETKDIEYFVDISASSLKAQRENARETYRQSNKRAKVAAEAGDYSEYASAGLAESTNILDSFQGNEVPLKISFALLVHAKSITGLDQRCHEIQSFFKPAELQREMKIAGRVWLQTLPCKAEHLLHVKIVNVSGLPPLEINFRHVYTGIQSVGLLPFAKTIANDPAGLELVGEDKQVLCLDFFSDFRQPHWACAAKQRTGKSNFANKVDIHAIARGQPVTYIDMPPDGDGASSLEDRCQLLGGSHVDLHKQSINLLGIPSSLLLDDSGLTKKQREDRFKSIQGGWLEYLMILGGPTEGQAQLIQVTRDLLKLSIDLYLDDKQIQTRYYNAAVGGFGSDAWWKTPTLADFQKFTKRYMLQNHLQDISGPVDEALKYLDLRLSRKCDPNTIMGQAISRPSTVNIEETLLTVFSMRGLESGSEEALAYCAGAYSIAIQKSLSYPISHVIVEEAQKAIKEPGVVRMMSDIITRYGKDGVRLGMVTNSFDDIADSEAGKALLNNITTKIIGPVSEASVERLSQKLNIPLDLVEKCASSSFYTDRKEGRMNVLLCDNGRHTFASFYPGWLSIALSASNRGERESRKRFFTVIENKYVAIVAFSMYIRYCFERGLEVQVLPSEQVKEFERRCNFSSETASKLAA
jgi:hypothetical protein